MMSEDAPRPEYPEESPAEGRRQTLRRRLLWVAVGLVFAALSAWGGWRAWRAWQPERLTRLAREKVVAGELRDAFLLLGRALQIDPNHVAATRALARLYEDAGLSLSLSWWQRAVELAPADAQSRLDLASAALRFGRADTARAALDAVPPAARASAEYHALKGTADFAEKKFPEAAKAFTEAAKLDPSNPEHPLNAANARLNFSDPAARADALAVIRRTAETSVGAPRATALRVLRQEAGARRDWPVALDASRRLLGLPEARWDDQLIQLSLLRESRSPELETEWTAIEKLAGGDAARAEPYLQWLHERRLLDRALAFFRRLGSELAQNPRIRGVAGGCLDAKQEWSALRDLAIGRPDNWGEREFYRQVLLARAEAGLGEREKSKTSWSRAVTEALRLPGAVLDVARIAYTVGWRDDAREALWRAVDSAHAESSGALTMLFSDYEEARDTRSLVRVFDRMVERGVGGRSAQNNFALLSLVLNDRTERSFALARTLNESDPKDPQAILLLAFAHVRQGRAAEGARLLRTLPAERLAVPEVAAYGTVILAAAGDAEGARRLAAVAAGAKLLPEERQIFDAAVKGLK